MDPTRFDSLSQAIATWATRHASRRTIVHFLGSGLVALAVHTGPGAVAKGNAGKKRRKQKLQQKCKRFFGSGIGTYCRPGGCKNLLTDDFHCGTCGHICDTGQTCVAGVCTGASAICSPRCAGKACGADDGCGGICGTGSCPEGKTCRSDGACVDAACDPPCGYNTFCQNGACVPAPNHCPTPFVCAGFDGYGPTCGTVAGPGGGECGCFRSTEGNNVCVNQTEADGTDITYTELIPCTTSQHCRETLGFHFYCRRVNNSIDFRPCGSAVGRCWPVCDSPMQRISEGELGDTRRVPRRRRRRREA